MKSQNNSSFIYSFFFIFVIFLSNFALISSSSNNTATSHTEKDGEKQNHYANLFADSGNFKETSFADEMIANGSGGKKMYIYFYC